MPPIDYVTPAINGATWLTVAEGYRAYEYLLAGYSSQLTFDYLNSQFPGIANNPAAPLADIISIETAVKAATTWGAGILPSTTPPVTVTTMDPVIVTAPPVDQGNKLLQNAGFLILGFAGLWLGFRFLKD